LIGRRTFTGVFLRNTRSVFLQKPTIAESWKETWPTAVFPGANQQIYETRAGRGFFTQDSKTIELGLGQATLVDTLTVRWPSGAVTTLNSVAANQVLDIVEP